MAHIKCRNDTVGLIHRAITIRSVLSVQISLRARCAACRRGFAIGLQLIRTPKKNQIAQRRCMPAQHKPIKELVIFSKTRLLVCRIALSAAARAAKLTLQPTNSIHRQICRHKPGGRQFCMLSGGEEHFGVQIPDGRAKGPFLPSQLLRRVVWLQQGRSDVPSWFSVGARACARWRFFFSELIH